MTSKGDYTLVAGIGTITIAVYAAFGTPGAFFLVGVLLLLKGFNEKLEEHTGELEQ